MFCLEIGLLCDLVYRCLLGRYFEDLRTSLFLHVLLLLVFRD